jgi:hypothetical protein
MDTLNERWVMLRKTEIIASNVLEQDSESQAAPIVSKRGQDEMCLETMRSIVKEYIASCQNRSGPAVAKESFISRYDQQRQQIHDEGLKAFTSFELMEKLYWQEYFVRE